MAASSSSSSERKKYDVFISFRGADIRTSFLSHLHKSLSGMGLEVFVDEYLERGEDITYSLLQTIEQSHLSLVIFSENYAFSPWCLDELVKISDCKEKMGQIVLPIFYRVDPTDVQELTGSFGAAIDKHREDPKISSRKVDTWCHVLGKMAELSGEDSQNFKDDSDLIKKIKEHILKKLEAVYPVDCDSYNRNLVGIDSQIKKVESLLCLESEDVRIIGIWGKGGIGKTTIANAVFDRIHHQFPTRYNLSESIREKAEKSTPYHLQNEILSKVLEIDQYSSNTAEPILSSPLNRRRLARSKVLIVLDDVSDSNQVEHLIQKGNYGPGSRIIMISRDKQLLINGGAEIYQVEELCESDSLELFCLHAFQRRTPEEGYNKLLKRALSYAQGLPLALNVLGDHLHGKSRQVWGDKLGKLQNTSNDKITKVLRINFDALDCKDDKEIFLDIACFFKGQHRVNVERILGTGSHSGIDHLVDKSLISISNYNGLEMHDLIQQMGKDIICEEEQVGMRSRLWDHEDICKVLKKNKGTGKIKGISLNMSKINHLRLSPEAFEGMDNLRYLKFWKYYRRFDQWEDYIYNYSKRIRGYNFLNLIRRYNNSNLTSPIHVPKGLNVLPGELRFLQWDGCPLRFLPKSFRAKNLVELRMCNCELKELWNGVEDLENLRIIDLSGSRNLVRIPDLSGALNLEVLRLPGCSSLEKIPSSFKLLSKLIEFDVSSCRRLGSLPDGLRFLKWDACHLESLPESFRARNLIGIHMHKSELKELWNGVEDLENLRIIDLSGSRNLVRIPDLSGALNLEVLRLSGCSSLEKIPSSFKLLSKLIEFDVSHCRRLGSLPDGLRFLKWDACHLESLPESFRARNLIGIHMHKSELKELWNGVEGIENVKIIDLSYSGNLIKAPDLSRALNLEVLRLSGCASLEEIPSSFEHLRKLNELNVSGSLSLRSLPSCLNVESLTALELYHHWEIRDLPEFICHERHARLVKLHLKCCIMLQSLPDSICDLKCLEDLNISGCFSLNGLPENFSNLQSLRSLDISGCFNLNGLPENFSNLQSLRSLDISGCFNLNELPENLRNLSSLKKIFAYESAIKYLPQLPSLDFLDVRNCTSLKSTSSSLQLIEEQKNRAIFRFDNCINLEEEERNKIMQIPLTLLESTKGFAEFELWIPGSEVPQTISNREKGGSLMLKQSERFSRLKGFYFAVVVDPSLLPAVINYCYLRYEITCSSSDGRMACGSPHRYELSTALDLSLKHVIIWCQPSNIPFADQVFFRFEVVDLPKEHYDAIVECGVEPVFLDVDDDESKEDLHDDDDDESEESLNDEDDGIIRFVFCDVGLLLLLLILVRFYFLFLYDLMRWVNQEDR